MGIESHDLYGLASLGDRSDLLFILAFIGLRIYRVWGFFMEALDIYGNELRTFLGIGMLAVPIGLCSTALCS